MEKIVLMGGGKYAGLLYAFFKDQFRFYGYFDDVHEKGYIEATYGIEKIGTSDAAEKIIQDCPDAVIAVGAEKDVAARRRYYEMFRGMGFRFPRLVHKSAQVFTGEGNIGEGVVIQPNVIVDPQAVIGANCVISRASVIGHDSRVGENTYVSPGVIVNGSSVIGDDCFIGTGSVIIQKRTIGNNVVIGAGSCVIGDIPEGSVAVGVPAKTREYPGSRES